MLTALLLSSFLSVSGSCQNKPVVCDSNYSGPSFAAIAAANPASTCASDTLTMTINDLDTVITYGTGWCASGGATCTSNKVNACVSLAAEVAKKPGIKSAKCNPVTYAVAINPQPENVQYFKLATSDSNCLTLTQPVSGGTVLLGQTKWVESGTGASTLYARDGSTAATVTLGTLTTSGLDTATGGLKTTKPLMLLDAVRFCGNGSNGTTPWFDGPVLASMTGTDMSMGSAGCDGNDSATEGTADAPLDAYMARKVVGMACTTQAGGTTNTNTFQLRSAVADVTGVTCSVVNDNANPQTCSVILSAPVTIAAGATLAVKNIQSGSDDMSGKDMGCWVYYTY